MLDNRQYIAKLCEEIKQKGDTPSVGILRSRSTRKLSVKEVIEALKHWKNTPRANTEKNPNKEIKKILPTKALEDRVASLEEQVIVLKKQLQALSNNGGS